MAQSIHPPNNGNAGLMGGGPA